jgi:hypothetical protein
LSALLAILASSLAGQVLAIAFLVSVGVSVIVYLYTAWLGRVEARFRLIRPRKFRTTMLIMFYGCSIAAFACLALSQRLAAWWPPNPLGAATGYFLSPIFLAAAAGIIRSWHASELVT